MRKILTESQVLPAALKQLSEFHLDVVNQVQTAVNENTIVVVGMRLNPYCKKACNLLIGAKMDFQYLEFGSYFAEWKPRLAIKMWSGWPTFPQVFVKGKLVGGFTELKQWVASTGPGK